jgi:hypothetical protein
MRCPRQTPFAPNCSLPFVKVVSFQSTRNLEMYVDCEIRRLLCYIPRRMSWRDFILVFSKYGVVDILAPLRQLPSHGRWPINKDGLSE